MASGRTTGLRPTGPGNGGLSRWTTSPERAGWATLATMCSPRCSQRFEVATAVRERAGLRWVVSPVRDRFTEVGSRNISQSYSIALFPYIEGIKPRAFDDKGDRHERTEVIRMLTELHGATPLVPEAPRHDPAHPRAGFTEQSAPRPGPAMDERSILGAPRVCCWRTMEAKSLR